MRSIRSDIGIIQNSEYLHGPLLIKRKPDIRTCSYEQVREWAKRDFGQSNQIAPFRGELCRFLGTDGHLWIVLPEKDKPYRMTEWSLRQMSLLLGLPFKLMNSMASKSTAVVLRDRCEFAFHSERKMPKDFHYVVPTISEVGNLRRLRCITSSLFQRAFDYEVLQHMGRHSGVRYARLARGERDMHLWMYSVNSGVDVEGRVFYPGLHIRNSEVGARMIEMTRTIVDSETLQPMYYGLGTKRRSLLRGAVPWGAVVNFLRRARVALEFMLEQDDFSDEIAAIQSAMTTRVADVSDHVRRWDINLRMPGASHHLGLSDIIKRCGQKPTLMELSDACRDMLLECPYEEKYAVVQRNLGADIDRSQGIEVIDYKAKMKKIKKKRQE